ncbi:MAG: TadE/TadG family protein [Alphaproteobacteria bacterium]|nr:MAG: TadE/TadG family protein [Alphaproteobacteria bacterium]
MFRSSNRFFRNTRGAFAMQFALMAVPLTICTGLAVDGGRAFLARFELASALDAAALAVGSTLQQQGTDLNAVAAKFVEKNFRTEHSEPIALSLVSANDTIVLKGTVKINTYFMPLVGQPTVTINAESEVRRGGSNIEVAMALDITGSMTTSRMTGLKAAANILIDEVVNPVQRPFFSKVAVVPWSQSINLVKPGTTATDTYVNNTALDQLRGGAIIGPRSISAASWRVSGASNIAIYEAGWRTTVGALTIASKANSGVDWRWGSSVVISSFAKVDVGTTASTKARIRVTTSTNHGYANGQFVRITGATGSYTDLNNNIYRVGYNTNSPESNTNKTFYLRKLDDSGWVAQPSGSTASGTAAVQRCYDSACNVGVTTTSAFTGLAAGNYVNVMGVSGFNAINNTDITTWQVADVMSSTNTFTIANWDGPSQGAMSAGAGTVSECLDATCRYTVKTGTASTPVNHGFSTTDFVAIWGMTEGGSGKSAVSALNTTWTVANPSGSIFYLPGKGKDYMDWKSGGSTARCQLASCNTRITVGASTPASTLSVGDLIEVSGVKGMTGVNNPVAAISSPSSKIRYTWRIGAINGTVLTLEDSSPAFANMTGNYTSAGVANCVLYGCARYDFVTAGGNANNYWDHRVFQASPCIVERYGDHAATDVAPATAPLSIYYTSNGTCTQNNYVTPLTPNKTRLEKAITDLATGGSTSGQLGIAWAWYLLSPNFGDVWDRDQDPDMTPTQVNVPLAYEAPETAKIAILMTDGEFNYATCNSVNTGTACTPAKTPFAQAEDICAAMKTQDIIIYTVGLELNTAQYSDDFLLKCATSPQHAFLANNNEELEQAFKDIAVSINRLRLSR